MFIVKLAITVWNQRIAPVFDSAGKAIILDTRGENQIDRREVDLVRENSFTKARFLREEGVRELICGAISREVENMLVDQGIRVLPLSPATSKR
jgi:predicted Fe-Mo cluster-binding NifX family protein